MSIVRMLAATIVGRTSDAEALLTAVQAAGLLHMTPMRPPEELAVAHAAASGEPGDPVIEARRILHVRTAIARVPEQAPEGVERTVDEIVVHAEELLRVREEAQSRLAASEATIAALEPFGDFDPADLDRLEAAGADVTFARLTWNDWRALDLSDVPHAIASQTELDVCVVFFGAEAAELPVTPLRLPRVKLSDARSERDALHSLVLEMDRRLGSLTDELGRLDERRSMLADRVVVRQALDGGLDAGPLFAVRGYVPAEQQVDLQRAIAAFACVLQFEDPVPGEDVPVKLHQPAALAGFGAIVKAFSGISYWEKDFTPAVALLFLVFGSLCLVDGGYGVLLLATGLFLRAKGNRDFGTVFAFTGAFSILVGLVAGQYFGLVVGKDGFLEGHKPPTALASDPMVSFIFSLIVGLVGMTFSYATAIWQRGWKTNATGSLLFALGAIATVVAKAAPGSVAAIVLSSTTPEHNAQVGAALSLVGQGMFGLGVASWLVWPEDVFGKGSHVPNVMWTLYSGVTGLGQDIMSHMRLFGIALSGSIMAMVVNQIAGLFPLAVTVAFAVVGHFFVFVLSLLSLYIHTNRLIFLEFGSKCFDGGQRWYEPLRPAGELSDEAAA